MMPSAYFTTAYWSASYWADAEFYVPSGGSPYEPWGMLNVFF